MKVNGEKALYWGRLGIAALFIIGIFGYLSWEERRKQEQETRLVEERRVDEEKNRAIIVAQQKAREEREEKNRRISDFMQTLLEPDPNYVINFNLKGHPLKLKKPYVTEKEFIGRFGSEPTSATYRAGPEAVAGHGCIDTPCLMKPTSIHLRY